MDFVHLYVFVFKMRFDGIGVEALKSNIPVIAFYWGNSFKTGCCTSTDSRNNIFLLALDQNPIVFVL